MSKATFFSLFFGWLRSVRNYTIEADEEHCSQGESINASTVVLFLHVNTFISITFQHLWAGVKRRTCDCHIVAVCHRFIDFLRPHDLDGAKISNAVRQLAGFLILFDKDITTFQVPVDNVALRRMQVSKTIGNLLHDVNDLIFLKESLLVFHDITAYQRVIYFNFW